MSEFDKAGAWDLEAIVKAQTPTNRPAMSPYDWYESLVLEDYQVNEANDAIFNELEQLCKPFHYELTPTASHSENLDNVATTVDVRTSTSPGIGEQKKKTTGVSCANTLATASRKRRNKRKMSLVRQKAEDHLLSDKWNWRKYGEKAIKGSLYPRSYYRCSSSIGCLARKQVEQSSKEAGMFLITYIDEHNHPYPTRRHSQSGHNVRRSTASAKQLLKTSKSTGTSDSAISEELVLSSNNHDLNVDVIGGRDVDHLLNMAWEDDFFAGLEYLEGLEMDRGSDQLSFDPFSSDLP